MTKVITMHGLKVFYSYKKEQKIFNKEPFPPQLRMIIIGRSGCGKQNYYLNYY